MLLHIIHYTFLQCVDFGEGGKKEYSETLAEEAQENQLRQLYHSARRHNTVTLAPPVLLRDINYTQENMFETRYR